MDRTWKIGLIGTAILGVGLAACVDEEPSLVMQGSIVQVGSVDVTEDEETGEVVGVEVSCAGVEPEFDDPSGPIRTAGYINVDDFEEIGQPVFSSGRAGGTLDELQGTPGQYIYQSVFENRLFDSRDVGSSGSGGDGGGFENIDQDQNDVMVEGATVEFELTDGSGLTFEATRLSSIHVGSSGGVATLGIPIFNSADELGFIEEEVRAMGFEGQELTVVAKLQLFGNTLGSRDVESNKVSYPITLCFEGDCRETDPQCVME